MSHPPPILSNAGPLITLGKLNRLGLLADLYDEVQIPRAVYNEVVVQGMARGAADALTIRLFLNQQSWPIVDVPHKILSAYTPAIVLDPGETEVLALAQTLPNPVVLLDDEAARTEARRLNLTVYGTLGVLIQSYRQNNLSYAESELLLQEIGTRRDIWISAKLCQQVLVALLKKP